MGSKSSTKLISDKVQITKGVTFELKPGRKYLMVVDPEKTSADTASRLVKHFHTAGMDLGVAMLEEGSYQLIEQKK